MYSHTILFIHPRTSFISHHRLSLAITAPFFECFVFIYTKSSFRSTFDSSLIAFGHLLLVDPHAPETDQKCPRIEIEFLFSTGRISTFYWFLGELFVSFKQFCKYCEIVASLLVEFEKLIMNFVKNQLM